jgi:LEA14-like dessication related protein
MVRALALVLAIAVAIGCSKPEPPTLVPKKATITSISPAAIEMQLDLDATNQNAVPLVVQSVTAQVKLDKQYDMGTASVTKSFDIPAGKTTTLSVPISIPWSNIGALVSVAASGRDVPYDVAGSATIGGQSINVTVPFTTSGTITRDQIAKATAASIPKIPGLTAP